MSCCGGSRTRIPLVPRPATVPITASTARATRAVFRYEGDRPIVVIGRATGTKYQFAGRGAEVAVDIRDRSSVVQVPRLRELRVI